MGKRITMFQANEKNYVLAEIYRLIKDTAGNIHSHSAIDNVGASLHLVKGFNEQTERNLEKALAEYKMVGRITEYDNFLPIKNLAGMKAVQIKNHGNHLDKYRDLVGKIDSDFGYFSKIFKSYETIHYALVGLAAAIEVDDKEHATKYLGKILEILPKAQIEAAKIQKETPAGSIRTTPPYYLPHVPAVPDFERAKKLLEKIS